MRLLVNATSYGVPIGGAGLRARYLCAALKGAWGIEPCFLLAEDTPEEVVPDGVESRRLPVLARSPLQRFLSLRLPGDGDAILTDHYPVGPLPTFVTLHDRGGSVLRRAMIRRTLRRAAGVIAVSNTVRDAWGVPAHVVPNGVALPAGDLPPPRDHLLLCDPGLPHKDAATAEAAAAEVGLPLRTVGRGVTWLRHDDLLRELAAARVVLCPSREEGFGMVLLEAIALGRPVVASDIPAHREVGGAIPVYFVPGNAAAFAAAVREALACDPARLERGKERAQRWTWDRAASLLAPLLLDCVRTRPR